MVGKGRTPNSHNSIQFHSKGFIGMDNISLRSYNIAKQVKCIIDKSEQTKLGLIIMSIAVSVVVIVFI